MELITKTFGEVRSSAREEIHHDAVFVDDPLGVLALLSGRPRCQQTTQAVCLVRDLIDDATPQIAQMVASVLNGEVERESLDQLLTGLFKKACESLSGLNTLLTSEPERKPRHTPIAGLFRQVTDRLGPKKEAEPAKPPQPSTVSVTLLVQGGQHAAVTHLGHNRAFLLRGSKSAQIPPEEQPAQRAESSQGEGPQPFRGYAAALSTGGGPEPGDVTCTWFRVREEDRIVLASQAFTQALPEADLRTIQQATKHAAGMGRAALDKADNERGPNDASCVIAEISLGERAKSTRPPPGEKPAQAAAEAAPGHQEGDLIPSAAVSPVSAGASETDGEAEVSIPLAEFPSGAAPSIAPAVGQPARHMTPAAGQPTQAYGAAGGKATMQGMSAQGQPGQHLTPAVGMPSQPRALGGALSGRKPPKIQPVVGDPTPFLKRVPLLAGLSDDRIRSLLELMGQQTLDEREVLYEKGEEGDALFIVSLGRLDETLANGQVVVIAPWTSAGERVLLGDFQRDATAAARNPCRVLRVDGPKLVELLAADRDLAATLYENLARRLAERFDKVMGP